MSDTIVILLILLIASQLLSIVQNMKISSKKSALIFYKQKLSEQESMDSDGARFFAFLVAFIIRSAIIYYSIISILAFIK